MLTCVQILKYVTRNVQKVLFKSFLIYPKMTRDDDMMLQNSKGWEELLIHSEEEVINFNELWVGGGHSPLEEEVINTLRLYIVTAQVQKALDLTLWDLDLDLRLEFGIRLVNILQTVSKKSIL